MKRDLLTKIEGGLWGLLVGDAVGVPYEFHPAREIPPREQIDMFPPPGFSRSYAHVPCGTWSDDGAQALCLTESLIERREWDPYNFARKLLAWASRGYLAADGKVFDIGIQTGEALRRLSAGATPYESGLAGERNNGNGGLMRSLPLALLLEAPTPGSWPSRMSSAPSRMRTRVRRCAAPCIASGRGGSLRASIARGIGPPPTSMCSTETAPFISGNCARLYCPLLMKNRAERGMWSTRFIPPALPVRSNPTEMS